MLVRYVKAVREAGFVVTAGTEHNTLDLIPMEPTCRQQEQVPEEIKRVFQEGACVVAAHQYLGLNGQSGYVDGSGNLNPDFEDGEKRIDYFHRLGAAVVSRTLKGSM